MGIEMPDINKIRKEIDEKNAEMEKKERERIKEEYERLSGQEKPTEEKPEEKPKEKSEEKIEQPMQRKDITEKLTPENVKAAENIKAAYKKGKFIEVKVKRSSGEIENGWVISSINPKTEEATVLKFTSRKGKDRSFVDKIVTLEELKEWNKPETEKLKGKKEKEIFAAKDIEDKEKKNKEQKLDPWELHNKWTKVCENLENVHDKYKTMNDCIDKSPEELHDYLDDNKSILSKEAKDWIKTKIDVDKEKIAHFKKWDTNKDRPTAKKEKTKENEEKGPKGKRANAKDIEWKKTKVDKKKKDKVFKGTKEKQEKKSIEENIKDQLEKSGLDSKEISKILPGLFESFKEPEVRKKIQKLIESEEFQEVQNIIEKTMKDSIQKKEEVAENEEKPDPRKSYKKREEVFQEFRQASDYNQVMDDTVNKNQEELNNYLKQNQSKLSKEAQTWIKEEIKEKEKEKQEKKSIEENIKDQLEKSGLDSKEISKILPGLFESFKKPEVRKKIQKLIESEEFQEVQNIIEKTIKEGEVPDSATEIKESIEKKEEKKESPWKTVFGTIGWSILLFLVLFMLAELKGIDYFSGQAAGKKKEKK